MCKKKRASPVVAWSEVEERHGLGYAVADLSLTAAATVWWIWCAPAARPAEEVQQQQCLASRRLEERSMTRQKRSPKLARSLNLQTPIKKRKNAKLKTKMQTPVGALWHFFVEIGNQYDSL